MFTCWLLYGKIYKMLLKYGYCCLVAAYALWTVL